MQIHEDHQFCNPIEDEKYPYYSEYEFMTHKLKTLSILKLFILSHIPHFTLWGFDNHVFMVDEHM